MHLSDLLGPDLISHFKGTDPANTTRTADTDKHSVYYLDSSFFNQLDRVKNKYLAIPGFRFFYNMDLNELAELTMPPRRSRTAVLATTEYLLPYVAYTLKYIEDKSINLEKGIRHTVPFIIYAPVTWSMEDNMHAIDVIAHEYMAGRIANIKIIIPTEKAHLFNPKGEPRVTLQEIYRLYKLLGDVEVDTRVDEPAFIITLKHKMAGGYVARHQTTRRQSRARRPLSTSRTSGLRRRRRHQ